MLVIWTLKCVHTTHMHTHTRTHTCTHRHTHAHPHTDTHTHTHTHTHTQHTTGASLLHTPRWTLRVFHNTHKAYRLPVLSFYPTERNKSWQPWRCSHSSHSQHKWCPHLSCQYHEEHLGVSLHVGVGMTMLPEYYMLCGHLLLEHAGM